MGRTFSLSELNYIIDNRIKGLGATGLQASNSTVVNVSNAAPPEIGQVLTIVSPTKATWQNSSSGAPLATTVPIDETPGISGAVGNENAAAHADHVHAMPPFGTVAGTFCEGNDNRLNASSGGIIIIGQISNIPSASSVSVGTVYVPTDSGYKMISDGSNWLIDVPYVSQVIIGTGDLSGWTYESGLISSVQIVSHTTYSTFHCVALNTSPDYVDFLPPISSFNTGPGGVWTITACFRYVGNVNGFAAAYQGIAIVLLDDLGHRFMWGPLLEANPLYTSASACGFTNHTRNYVTIGTLELSNITPALFTLFFRVRFDGTSYYKEYSSNGVNWVLSSHGDASSGPPNVVSYNGINTMTPTHWGVGCELIPTVPADFDILMLRQTPTNG